MRSWHMPGMSWLLSHELSGGGERSRVHLQRALTRAEKGVVALEEDQPQELHAGPRLSAPSLSHFHRQPHPWYMGLLAGGGALFTDP